ncbi:hypothetical protein GTP38_17335 [Duganella sp. FT94W]|uniref:DUF3757 domain-containing protein n=1 Tax=Duganella lactea TaxID=2692173 RepID=A0ABW9VBS9_9BURK|nr:hypothetical protein [Duganella lactea]MYM36098.1 hypothetical protein [Duganella lactea]
MIFKRVFGVLAVFTALIASGAVAGELQLSGCTTPPPDAAGRTIKSSHPHLPGMKWVPARIDDDYTGCVYVWFICDDDEKLLYHIGRFERGGLLASAMFVDDDMPAVSCRAADKEAPEQYGCKRSDGFWRDFRKYQDMPDPK